MYKISVEGLALLWSAGNPPCDWIIGEGWFWRSQKIGEITEIVAVS
jgi:hypothetical protein